MLPHHDLLRVGLRSRATTVDELAELAMSDPDMVRTALEQLADEGHLHLRGDQIVYDAPDRVMGRMVRRRADRLALDVGEQLAQLAALVEGLPDLLHEWQVNGGEAGPMEVEVFHGWSAVTDLWHELLRREPLRRTDVIVPEAARLQVADPAMQSVWHEVVSTPGNRARVIGNIADTADPAMATRISQELAGGVELRMMPDPPSWFWVADGAVVALPLLWGETWPTSVVAIHSPAVAGLAQWAFDRLWDAAVPVGAAAHGWDSLLRLMTRGATLEAASRTLGISDRTGRRRVAEAMAFYGVGNMLALGAAWGAGVRPTRS
jgi:hypothetical protein